MAATQALVGKMRMRLALLSLRAAARVAAAAAAITLGLSMRSAVACLHWAWASLNMQRVAVAHTREMSDMVAASHASKLQERVWLAWRKVAAFNNRLLLCAAAARVSRVRRLKTLAAASWRQITAEAKLLSVYEGAASEIHAMDAQGKALAAWRVRAHARGRARAAALRFAQGVRKSCELEVGADGAGVSLEEVAVGASTAVAGVVERRRAAAEVAKQSRRLIVARRDAAVRVLVLEGAVRVDAVAARALAVAAGGHGVVQGLRGNMSTFASAGAGGEDVLAGQGRANALRAAKKATMMALGEKRHGLGALAAARCLFLRGRGGVPGAVRVPRVRHDSSDDDAGCVDEEQECGDGASVASAGATNGGAGTSGSSGRWRCGAGLQWKQEIAGIHKAKLLRECVGEWREALLTAVAERVFGARRLRHAAHAWVAAAAQHARRVSAFRMQGTARRARAVRESTLRSWRLYCCALTLGHRAAVREAFAALAAALAAHAEAGQAFAAAVRKTMLRHSALRKWLAFMRARAAVLVVLLQGQELYRRHLLWGRWGDWLAVAGERAQLRRAGDVVARRRRRGLGIAGLACWCQHSRERALQRRVVGRALELWGARWQDESDPLARCFELLGAAMDAWRIAAREVAEERVSNVKLRAACIFWRVRSWTRSVALWKAALVVLRRRRLGEERLVRRRRLAVARANLDAFRAAVLIAVEARVAEESLRTQSALRVWRAELRRERGGARQKQRVLREWGAHMWRARHLLPGQHWRRAVLRETCARWRYGRVLCVRQRRGKRLLFRTGLVRATGAWKRAVVLQAHARHARVLAAARRRRAQLLLVTRQWASFAAARKSHYLNVMRAALHRTRCLHRRALGAWMAAVAVSTRHEEHVHCDELQMRATAPEPGSGLTQAGVLGQAPVVGETRARPPTLLDDAGPFGERGPQSTDGQEPAAKAQTDSAAGEAGRGARRDGAQHEATQVETAARVQVLAEPMVSMGNAARGGVLSQSPLKRYREHAGYPDLGSAGGSRPMLHVPTRGRAETRRGTVAAGASHMAGTSRLSHAPTPAHVRVATVVDRRPVRSRGMSGTGSEPRVVDGESFGPVVTRPLDLARAETRAASIKHAHAQSTTGQVRSASGEHRGGLGTICAPQEPRVAVNARIISQLPESSLLQQPLPNAQAIASTSSSATDSCASPQEGADKENLGSERTARGRGRGQKGHDEVAHLISQLGLTRNTRETLHRVLKP